MKAISGKEEEYEDEEETTKKKRTIVRLQNVENFAYKPLIPTSQLQPKLFFLLLHRHPGLV